MFLQQKESIDKLINERDKMGEQYQQYIQQLSQQVASLRDEVRYICIYYIKHLRFFFFFFQLVRLNYLLKFSNFVR